MNKNLIIGIVVVAAVALAAWWLAAGYPGANTTQGDQNATTTQGTTSSTGNTSGTSKSTATLKSIFTQSGNYECDYEIVSASARTSNRIYISGGNKMRGEFRMTAGNITTTTLMVYNGGYLYIWSEGQTTGAKIKISSVADLPQAIPADLTSGTIYGSDQNSVGWGCHSWNTDKTLLTVPAYVNFM